MYQKSLCKIKCPAATSLTQIRSNQQKNKRNHSSFEGLNSLQVNYISRLFWMRVIYHPSSLPLFSSNLRGLNVTAGLCALLFSTDYKCVGRRPISLGERCLRNYPLQIERAQFAAEGGNPCMDRCFSMLSFGCSW